VKEGAGGLQTDYFEAYFQQTVSCSPLRSKYIILSGFSTCPGAADRQRTMHDTTPFSKHKSPQGLFEKEESYGSIFLH
jgi:hypothetical protein